MSATLLFVHGTGVRSADYGETIDTIREKVSKYSIPCKVDYCLWGETLGIDFEGLSLPDPPERSPQDEQQLLHWEYLQIDPLFDLKLWSAPSTNSAPFVLGEQSAAQTAWEQTISRYTDASSKRVELSALLEENELGKFFLPAWNKVVDTGLPEEAFKQAGDEDSSVARVFAEAVVAQMMHGAAAASPPVPLPPPLGNKIVDVMLFDWNQQRKGLKDLFLKVFGAATKTIARPLRTGASRAIAPAVGDILNYQAVGQRIRKLIQDKIPASGDVFLLSHSLGGIACFELMVEARQPGGAGLNNVKGLITLGSQAPLLYEFNALQTLRKGKPLPVQFPPWLNVYDENDMLSYRADRLFNGQFDLQVDSMLPPAHAHSAYWKLATTWEAISAFMKDHAAKEPHG